MSDYQKNKEHFMMFREKFEYYFDHYTYVYYQNHSDYMFWFIIDSAENGDSGDFLFGEIKELGNMAFFFDSKKEADNNEFAKIKGLLIEKGGMQINYLDDVDLKKLKRKIKRGLKSPDIAPEGQMPSEESREKYHKRIEAQARRDARRR